MNQDVEHSSADAAPSRTTGILFALGILAICLMVVVGVVMIFWYQTHKPQPEPSFMPIVAPQR